MLDRSFQFPEVQLFSFLFGIILGILMTLVVMHFHNLKPHFLKSISDKKNVKKKVNVQEQVEIYKRFLLRKCQGNHLAESFFPLDDIYVELGLISKPFPADPSFHLDEEPIVFSIFDPLSVDPLVVRNYPVPTLTLFEAISGGKHIAISGEIGSGKTSFLSHSISMLLESKNQGKTDNFFPVYIHINDLNLSDFNNDFFVQYSDYCQSLDPAISSEVLVTILKEQHDIQRLVFVIDGIDELKPGKVDLVSNILAMQMHSYPLTRFIITLGQYYSSNLEDLGFTILPICYPSNNEIRCLVNKWHEAVKKVDRTEINQEEYQIRTLWMDQNNIFGSMYEETIKIWTNLWQGTGGTVLSVINSLLPIPLSEEFIAKVINKMMENDEFQIPFKEFEKLVSEDIENNPSGKKNIPISDQDDIETHIDSISIITRLKDYGIITVQKNQAIAIKIPAVLCSLASQNFEHLENQRWDEVIYNPISDCILSRYPVSSYAINWLGEKDRLHRPTGHAFRHLQKKPVSIELKDIVTKKIIDVISSKEINISQKFQSLFYFASIFPIEFRNILIRLDLVDQNEFNLIAAYPYSVEREINFTQHIKKLLSKKHSQVNYFGCIQAVERFLLTEPQIIKEIFEYSNDEIKRFIAELLALKPGTGHNLLGEFAHHEDMRFRRAAIYGLRLIKMSWANDLIQSMSTEDEQWFVRDAAATVVEHPWSKDLYIPKLLPNPSEAAWLIKAASDYGEIIPTNEFPLDLLIKIIKYGNTEEQLVAMNYLVSPPPLIRKRMEHELELQKNDLGDYYWKLVWEFSKKKQTNSVN